MLYNTMQMEALFLLQAKMYIVRLKIGILRQMAVERHTLLPADILPTLMLPSMHNGQTLSRVRWQLLHAAVIILTDGTLRPMEVYGSMIPQQLREI